MQRFTQPNIAPIGGYRFTDPDTGDVYNRQYRNFAELEEHVTKFRLQNKLPMLKKLRAIWEAYVCANVSAMRSRCCDVEAVVERNFTQYFRGAKAFFQAAIQKAEAFVSQEVADERAAICIKCDQNVVDIGHKAARYYSDRFMLAQVGKRKSEHHAKLHTCKLCSCILKAKVFYVRSLVVEKLTNNEIMDLKRYPVDTSGHPLQCWQLKELEEHLKNGEKEKT